MNRNDVVGERLDETNVIEDSVTPDKQLALVTGASTGIGLELAKCTAEAGLRGCRQPLRGGSGRNLITGSIAGFMPGSFQAVYNASKAFLDSFSFALREELRDSGITVTCLMPGATETEFFRRADMMDTKVGIEKKDGARDVAKAGFDAMMRETPTWGRHEENKLQTAIANVTPNEMLARQHRKMAEPGSVKS